MLFWLLSCKLGDDGGKAPADGSAPPESVVDSPPEDSAAPPWPDLSLDEAWESTELDVATGIGLLDIDQDGDLDLLVANGNDITPGPLRLYRNDGGVLETTASWMSDTQEYYGHLSVGDLDGDGLEDVVVSRFLGPGRFTEPGGVERFMNLGGALEPSPSWTAEGLFSFSNALGDIDGDGDLDLAVAVGEPYKNPPGRSCLYLNDGAGDLGLAPAWTTERDRHAMDVAFVDLNGDGALDLAIANLGDPHTVYLNEGGLPAPTPSWEAPEDLGPYEGNTVDWGDVNGDGALDLVISDNLQLGGPGVVRAWCGPELSLCWTSKDEAAYQSALSLEDVDGDGDLDLFAGSWWGAGRLYLNDGAGLSPTPSATTAREVVYEALAWADLDGSHREEVTLSGVGLAAVPGRAPVTSVVGAVSADGWISGPGAWTATALAPAPRDLLVTTWDKNVGNLLFQRAP
ncbi:VCBS repeat-containing protein [Myxococcota bacterium]|nr:VCBS repeat-containing protein [Myxococcota bacterium]